jgi:hypothetical protein
VDWPAAPCKLAPAAGASSVTTGGSTKTSRRDIGRKADMRIPIMRRVVSIAVAVFCAAMAIPTTAATLLTKATTVPTLMLSAGKAFPKEPIELEAGKYYRWTIECDGTNELGVMAPEFFRYIWINEVVVNKIEIRPLGLHSIEFDAKGAATISFVPIRPGEFEYYLSNSKSDAFRGKIIVK